MIGVISCGALALLAAPAQVVWVAPAAPLAQSVAPVRPTDPAVRVGSADAAMARLRARCDAATWCTPSFWAWELLLASHLGQRHLARLITVHLADLQEADGRWGLGTAWGFAAGDFKRRTARDAESWEVAEVGLALVHARKEHQIAVATAPAREAAGYLARRIVRYRGGSYLAHMPECNRRLQPHSTLAAAALLSEFPRYRRQAAALRRSGVAMGWRRIIPGPGDTSLQRARWGSLINDYERIQVGWYLDLMGQPRGARILGAFAARSGADFYRAAPYLVLVQALRGEAAAARRRASALTGFEPKRGYDLALVDWIEAVAARRSAVG